jgi:hypothetical protein
MNLEYYKNVLMQAGVVFERGLSQAEIQQIEDKYNFRFPPDLKDLLSFALPTSKGFLNWREADEDSIVQRLLWPYIGICFDIQQNDFWLTEWGERPSSLDEAFAIARKAFDDAPTLIPIRSHRYIPDRPNEARNPIFSVYQTDIIYYGANLGDYLENEFAYYFGESAHSLSDEIKYIEFWSAFTGDAI